MTRTHVWPQAPRPIDSVLRLSAIVATDGMAQEELWFDVPAEAATEICSTADPFLISALFVAMRRGSDLEIHGEVSRGLLEGLCDYQAAWLRWRPQRYRRIGIAAERERRYPADGVADRPAIQTFSGGVDSAFTCLRHVRGLAGPATRALGSAVLIHGFDIPLHDGEAYGDILGRSRRVLADAGVRLLPVRTNFRQLWHQDLSHWEDAFATGMVACLMLFAGSHGHGLIASSEPYDALLLPWGSNPVTDQLLSTEAFRVHHDAAGYTRNEKVRALSDWPAACDNLRVCWQGDNKAVNCCRCEKCIRTILNFLVVEVAVPKAFPYPVAAAHIRSLRGLGPAHVNPLRQILAEAEQNGTAADWVDALADCIAANEADIQSGRCGEGSMPQLVPAE